MYGSLRAVSAGERRLNPVIAGSEHQRVAQQSSAGSQLAAHVKRLPPCGLPRCARNDTKLIHSAGAELHT